MTEPEKTAYFRCDASPEMGSGHIMRCLTLALALQNVGWNCVFLSSSESAETVPALKETGFDLRPPSWNPPEAEILIVDHYGLDRIYESQARSWARRILVIDDLADRPHDCDILLDQTYGRLAGDYASLVPAQCNVLAGPQYALLRPQFARARARALTRRIGAVDRVLVSMGGTNIHNITVKVLEGVDAFTDKKLAIDVVLGKGAPYIKAVEERVRNISAKGFHTLRLLSDVQDMADLMAQADMGIGAGGTTSWERCCLGLPSIIIEIADNQRLLARELDRAGAACSLGWHEDVDTEILVRTLKTYLEDNTSVRTMAKKAAALCDGRGLDRILPFFPKAQIDKDGRVISLRFAEYDDAEMIYDWQKLPETRQHFRDTRTPAWEEHRAWMDKILKDPSFRTYIIECARKPAGLLRLDRREPNLHFEISLLLDPAYKGKGVAAASLRLARSIMPGAEFFAEILPENKLSAVLFQRAGFYAIGGSWYKQDKQT
jgi:UDP-2,4-diacetamido-2,4,6-trideoxy-beta-L-altropyranose hydrolase